MPEPGSVLLMAAGPLLHRVHVDERQDITAGQQWRLAGQLGQEPAANGVELAHVTPGERAQGRSQRGRRPDPAE
jgi:hypothetical protein